MIACPSTALVQTGASTPWQRTRLRRGGGTRAASFSSNSCGDSSSWQVPSAQCVFNVNTNVSASTKRSLPLAMGGRIT